MRDSLCWSCAHAIRKIGEHECPWAWNFEPVEGWVAEQSTLKGSTPSYCVKECPMFEDDGGREEGPWSDELEYEDKRIGKVFKRTKEMLDGYLLRGKLPPIYKSSKSANYACKQCKYFSMTGRSRANDGRMVQYGLCSYKNRNERTSYLRMCVAFEAKGETDGADESAPDHP